MGEIIMGAAREKDQADFDLETFVDLFDTAMSSDNPAVQRALKNLLMIAAIVNAEDPDAGMRQGPLRRVIDDQRNIIRRLERVEDNKIYPQSPSTPYGPVTPGVPLGPYVSPNTQPYTWPNTGTGSPPPNQIWCSSQTVKSASDYDNLFKKLETK